MIHAARAQFVRSGIKGARIEDITHASGLSKGAFYLHFDSKEALFAELVDAFSARMEALVTERERAVHAWLRTHPLTTRQTEALFALEAKYDRAVLELIWSERDVFAVLSRGAQGTPFEGMLWELAEREVKRVVASFDSMKSAGACRDDVPSEVVGSLVVGTYLLIGQRLSRLSKKPDLGLWVEAIQQLIHQGIAPKAAHGSKRRAS